jgi:CubicO group peptidase (beta-lactamase class C family)
MRLVELGQERLNDPVARYIPEFGVNGKQDITIRQLLVHYSGLAPDIPLDQIPNDYHAALQIAFAEKPSVPPGTTFIYSDANFIVLAALVERVSGMSLDKCAQVHIFLPLKMSHTRFLPPASWLSKIAPTEYDEHGKMLRGVVHDPRSRRMGGVAGHAGLFSTADDLSKFAQALLDGG